TYVLSRRRRGDAGTEPLSRRGAALGVLREWLASLALLGAWPFRLHAEAAMPASRWVALVVPESRCSSAGFWYLRRRLRACGWATVAGVPRAGGERDGAAVAVLDTRLAALPAETELILLGHGIGGLIAREYAEARPHLHVRHVITLGTPHQGSRSLPYRLLGAAMAAPPTGGGCVDVIAIYSDFDAWLLP